MDGQTPAAEMQQLRDDRMAGRIGQDKYIAEVERLAPQVKAPAPASTAPQARAELDALWERRRAGKVTEADYLTQVDRLAPLAAKDAPPTAQQTREQELQAALDPPASGDEYRFNYRNGAPYTPEGIESDRTLRAALKDAGVPVIWGGPIIDAIETNIAKLANATEQQVAQHLAETDRRLSQLFGSDRAARVAKIDEFIDALASKNPRLAAIAEKSPHLLVSAEMATYIDRVVQLRAARK